MKNDFLSKNNLTPFLIELWKFLTPILYLLAWILLLKIAKDLLGDKILENSLFLFISLVITFIGIISRSTSWSIFGDKGIKGDSLGRYVDFHSGGNPPWDYKMFFSNEKDAKEKVESSEKIVEMINRKVVEKS